MKRRRRPRTEWHWRLVRLADAAEILTGEVGWNTPCPSSCLNIADYRPGAGCYQDLDRSVPDALAGPGPQSNFAGYTDRMFF